MILSCCLGQAQATRVLVAVTVLMVLRPMRRVVGVYSQAQARDMERALACQRNDERSNVLSYYSYVHIVLALRYPHDGTNDESTYRVMRKGEVPVGREQVAAGSRPLTCSLRVPSSNFRARHLGITTASVCIDATATPSIHTLTGNRRNVHQELFGMLRSCQQRVY
ncbi:hypothetical protein F5Y07DRAFT_127864 [Xylaria sp. FL0933]|nr:hypothetical protein F5Y07DRAFT_127864 [Xylaria sp. FL0933]